MRRLVLLALALGLVGGPGLASGANINGTQGPDRLIGTPEADVLHGRSGADVIEGRGGNDLMTGGPGRDRLFGGAGDDRVSVHADGDDRVQCGPGQDIVTADHADAVAADCEVVSRRLSRDPYSNPDSQHETQVEPDSFAAGSTIVTAFQAGRYVFGGATNIGYSTSRDGGRTWRAGYLPGLSIFGTPPGLSSRATDPVVAYDAAHRVWLIASLAATQVLDELLISRSRDGLKWSLPVRASRGGPDTHDKEWIVCDNWSTSRFRGHCYLSYLELDSGRLVTRTSRDGGLTWSPPAGPSAGPAFANGAFPVVRPDGRLVVLYVSYGRFAPEEISAVSSSDGGLTFGRPVRVAPLSERDIRGVRSPTFPSAEVDAAGEIYAAWHDCTFPPDDCSGNDIMFATSREGERWSAAVRVPIPNDSPYDVDRFVPGLAVDRATSGNRARVAIAYHSLPECFGTCRAVDVGLISSANGGASWTRPQLLSAQPMQLPWLALTGVGLMLGDYISTSYVGGKAVPLFSLASPPVGGQFRQAIFATTRVSGAAPGARR